MNIRSEILQNLGSTDLVEERYDEETDTVISYRKRGDYVVCNLSSVNLSSAVPAGVLDRLMKIQMRMLDNVIDVNPLPVVAAAETNKRYRPVGAGTFGWANLLALEGIYWESDEAIARADELYEDFAFNAISASVDLAEEKGAYPYFKGSDFDTQAYFELRGYTSPRWMELRERVAKHGIRNGYLMAIAPNSSTAKIGDSTDGIDPLYELLYIEEKKNFKIKVTAPNLDHNTYAYYQKTRYKLDQTKSILQNAKRQRHIDQGISFNMYVFNDIKVRDLLELHMTAWVNDLKTTYYTRSTAAGSIDECEACHS